jgi:polysaccharide biosynthesis transport protein
MNELTQVSAGRVAPPVQSTEVARLPRLTVARPYGVETTQPWTLSFVLSVVRRWWKVTLVVGLIVAAGLAAAAYVHFQPQYEAEAWLRVEKSASLLADDSAQSQAESVLQTEIAILRSPLVLGPVVSDTPGSGSEAAGEDAKIRDLLTQVKAESVGQSQLLRVSCTDADPTQAAVTVNAVVASYFNFCEHESRERGQRVIELLEQEQERRAADVVRAYIEVGRLSEQAAKGGALVASGADGASADQSLSNLEKELSQSQVDEEMLRAEIVAAEEQLEEKDLTAVIPESTVQQRLAERPEIARLTTGLADKRSKLHQIAARSRLGAEDPFHRQLVAEITEDERTLAGLQSDLRQQVEETLKTQAIEQRRTMLAQKQLELKRRELLGEHLRQRVARLAGSKESAAEVSELAVKRRELKRAEDVLELIGMRVAHLKAERQAPTRVSLLRSASVPTAPVKSLRAKAMMAAPLVGLACPLLLALVLERNLRRVQGARMLEQATRLPVIGETPRLPMRRPLLGALLPRRHTALPLFCESIDTLRTCLMLSEGFQDLRTLLVTSAVSGEGKTCIAALFAASLAETLGETVAVVDADMRAPDLHDVFRVRLEPGLTDVLCGSVPLEAAMVTSWHERLHLLPAGRLRTSPHALVGGRRLEAVLKELSSVYRFVVIDGPPVLAASEAIVLAKSSDATILCAMQDNSRMDRVLLAEQRLLSTQTRLLGMVLNGVSARQYSYRYGP